MQKYLPRHLNKKTIFSHTILLKQRKISWKNKPTDWSDIRKDCPANSIALYVGHKADYSQYDNLGFTATCTGGYKVYIDEELYSTYNSGATCTITWSEYTATAGESITTPSALTSHKIWIEPATSGNNITAFSMGDSSLREGLLWLYSNINDFNSMNYFIGRQSGSSLVKAITAKNNYLKSSAMSYAFAGCPSLEYLPVLDFNNATGAVLNLMLYGYPNSNLLKNITIKNLKQTGNVANSYCIISIFNLEKIVLKNSSLCWYNTLMDRLHNLKKIPEGIYNHTGGVTFTEASSLEPTVLDFRDRTEAGWINVSGTSQYFMGGLKGLRVSNEAPFNGEAPQINVSYTGLNKTALIQLFNDLPSVSSGQIINIIGCTGTADLTQDDKEIAISKGWNITE